MQNLYEKFPFLKGYDLEKLPSLADLFLGGRKIAGMMPFSDDIFALYFCAIDPSIPMKVKVTIVAALAYLVLPLDVIPDITPFAGLTDDAAVLATVYSLVAGYLTTEHRRQAEVFLHPMSKKVQDDMKGNR